MRYVVDLDPGAYLAELPHLAGRLPPGAARFATDPGHYDFHGLRCVKDLVAGELEHDRATATVRIRFTGNPWKHDEDLLISYTGVKRIHTDTIGIVRLDEILPAPEGCSHEIAGLDGTLRIVCADLTASWHRAPRDDDPPPGEWAPVLPLGDRWNWLGRHRDGTWVVGVPHRRAVPADERMDALVHVLTRPWRAVTRQWPEGAPALDGIVGHALGTGSWEQLVALDWLEDGYPLPGVRAALEALRAGRGTENSRRGRANRLLKAAEGGRGRHGR